MYKLPPVHNAATRAIQHVHVDVPCIKAESCADGFKRSIMQGPLVKCPRQAAHYRNVQSRGARFSTFFPPPSCFFVMGERFLPLCQIFQLVPSHFIPAVT